jgi:PiT family inorganic phosphate transporter
VLSHAVTVHVFAMVGVPVSSSQAIVGAVLGIGLVKGLQVVRGRTLVRVVLGWVSTPVLAGLVAALLLFVARMDPSG